MERNSTITSTAFIKSTFENISINSDLTLKKINEMISSLDKASKSIIIPVLKLKKKITLKLQNFLKNYKEIKTKAMSSLNELNISENANNSMSITNMQLNQKYANEHEELIDFYDKVTEVTDLFTNLFKSESFGSLINGFDNLIHDDEIFDSLEEDVKEIDSIENNNIKIKNIKKNIKKKKLEPNNSDNGKGKLRIKKSLKESGISKKKLGTHNKDGNKRKKIEKDLLAIVQSQFPSSNYVQKISKTFLQRRLNKRIIYKHVFTYNKNLQNSNINDNDEENINSNNNNCFKEERERSSGDSTVYKYSKFTFTFENDDKDNKDKLIEFFSDKYLKHSFVKDNDHTNEENQEKLCSVIIAGRLSKELNDVLNELFRTNKLSESFNVKEAVIEFYEFYEELASEFPEDDDKVKINCDEKFLGHLREDFQMLEMVRDFVNNLKKKE